MRKTKLISYFILATVTFAGLFMYACKKEKLPQSSVPQKSAIVEKITDFRNKIDRVRDNSYTRSGNDNVTVDSAIWYLEAITNYTYSDPAYEYSQILEDSAIVSLPVTNGLIDIANVQIAYDSLIQALATYNSNIEAANKRLLTTGVVLREEATRSDEVSLKMYYSFGTDTEVDNAASFSWRWAFGLGQCPGGSELPPPNDAAKRIAWRANLTLPTPPANVIYVDLSTEIVKPEDVIDENGVHMLYYKKEYGEFYHPCITREEILQYKDNVLVIGQEYKPYPKDIVSYSVEGFVQFVPEGENNPTPYYALNHILTVTYGTPIERIDPINDLPTTD